ncbi:hypothetical protein PSJ8397_00166 [Pseudooctadecabacter jejudonensis]|uniref:Uncharacterized protein n=1 Tax=Pseudooctadecabacter jejudonensis TaxID=1391910 RepID=A0A1Y5R9M3_9RHOB|nr:hypothetical protein PSJ8397_00166 [Pseudooctadecabacter jejudonensis]
MSLLQTDQRVDKWHDTKVGDARSVRKTSPICNWIVATWSPRPTGQGSFKTKAARHDYYLSIACPCPPRRL